MSNKILFIVFLIYTLGNADLSKTADSLHNIGLNYFADKDYANAVEIFLQEISIDPKRHKAYNNIGVTYRRRGIYDSAKVYHKKAIDVYPQYAHAYYSLALAYFYCEELLLAEEFFVQSIDLGYHNANAFYYAGWTMQKNNKCDLALNMFDKTMATYYYYPGLHYRIGLCKLREGDIDHALLSFKREEKNNRKYQDSCYVEILKIRMMTETGIVDSLIEIAKKLYTSGSKYRASKNYAYAIKLAPQNINISMVLINMYIELNMNIEAIGILNNVLMIDPNNNEASKILDKLKSKEHK